MQHQDHGVQLFSPKQLLSTLFYNIRNINAEFYGANYQKYT